MSIPTSQANLKIINSAYQNLEKLMVNLYRRWLDEKDFEDIEDYGDIIQSNLPSDIVMVRVTKKPFGFVFHVNTEARYRMFINSRSEYGWERIS